MKKIRVLFSTEMWEKFNFYGMRAIFALFLVHFLAISETDAAIYYGAFLALSYLTPIIGGFLADKFLGYHKSVIIGCALLTVAQLFFYANASSFGGAWLTLCGAVLVMCGNGFFKPSITALLSIKAPRNVSMDAVFSSYYFFLNLGVLLGSFIVPYFGDVVVNGVRDVSAFKFGFLSAFVAMSIGLLVFVVFCKNDENFTPKVSDGIRFDLKNALVSLFVFVLIFAAISYFSSGANIVKSYLYPTIYAFGISLGFYVLLDESISKDERKNIITIFISAVFIVFFWASFEQIGSSLTFIANNQMDRNLLGFDIPPSMISMFNPLFVLVLSFVFSAFYIKLGRKNLEPNGLYKQALGLCLMGVSYLIIALNVRDLGDELLHIRWFILLYFMHTCAELLVSPIGFALVAKLSPKRLLGLIFGIFYLANATGYALSGTLASLLPPTADKFIKASELGINLKEILNQRAEISEVTLEILKANNLPSSYPQIFGYEISTLFHFFILFFILCFGAGVLLFAICRAMDRTNARAC
ncbi:MFS transporter [Campylobacter sp. RM9344]|uniref:MFS transporter n=1 Tax=Campylobacter californiensis TaxID=1032243 RepID=A0AAW3ZTK3_9BACT|nr:MULTISPECIES: oligopeptide:H+ symporter [unclassified Campylobacter]MBE2984138.1 MFS transporter [Campylobacter sp. RM6883]MBE2995800.1 MFS transporter [Campylobacter sp. RM6913]MBE3030339.1 MFS transporter [Campylobacter sp. RM9344]MBE3607809.1 MFS transporter [Campylobacter sp. RM9337]QCD51417.1 dipeptide/tripeptide permease [Campylobacter sp. RM6914]